MFTVTSIHAADIDAQRLSAVVSDYMALEQARIFRQLFLMRFGPLAIVFGIAGLGLHWMPTVVAEASVAVCIAIAACAWIAELRCDWRLSKRLEELPATAGPSSPT
jgi:hypothetical protein